MTHTKIRKVIRLIRVFTESFIWITMCVEKYFSAEVEDETTLS